jgi:hypothetical protein
VLRNSKARTKDARGCVNPAGQPWSVVGPWSVRGWTPTLRPDQEELPRDQHYRSPGRVGRVPGEGDVINISTARYLALGNTKSRDTHAQIRTGRHGNAPPNAARHEGLQSLNPARRIRDAGGPQR